MESSISRASFSGHGLLHGAAYRHRLTAAHHAARAGAGAIAKLRQGEVQEQHLQQRRVVRSSSTSPPVTFSATRFLDNSEKVQARPLTTARLHETAARRMVSHPL
jgi:hypothetical protein